MNESIELNESQQVVYDSLLEFIANKKLNTFILNGYAGTGKTFLMQYLSQYLNANKIPFRMMATTGRAAGILKGKLNLEVKTVHSNIYRFDKMEGIELDSKENENNYGQLFLNFSLSSSSNTNELIIVDEASMLSNILQEVEHTAQFGSGNVLEDFLNCYANNKIIFVGDPAQLPPVGQEESPALSSNILSDMNRNCTFGTLTEIMRTHADNDILEVAHHVRSYLNINPDNLAKPIWPRINAKYKRNLTVLGSNEGVFEKYLAQFKKDKLSCIAITKSNRSCYTYNQQFRGIIYPNNTQAIQVGEIMLVTQNNYIQPLTNGDFIEVLSTEQEHQYIGYRFVNARIKVLTSDLECEILINLDAVSSHNKQFTTEQHQRLMADFAMRMKKRGITPNSECFNEYLQKDKYLNSLKCTYGYFITCHKAQGGEWPYIFILTEKAMTPTPKHVAFIKWWYTALTRAKEHVYLNDGYWISKF